MPQSRGEPWRATNAAVAVTTFLRNGHVGSPQWRRQSFTSLEISGVVPRRNELRSEVVRCAAWEVHWVPWCLDLYLGVASNRKRIQIIKVYHVLMKLQSALWKWFDYVVIFSICGALLSSPKLLLIDITLHIARLQGTKIYLLNIIIIHYLSCFIFLCMFAAKRHVVKVLPRITCKYHVPKKLTNGTFLPILLLFGQGHIGLESCVPYKYI